MPLEDQPSTSHSHVPTKVDLPISDVEASHLLNEDEHSLFLRLLMIIMRSSAVKQSFGETFTLLNHYVELHNFFCHLSLLK